MGTNGASGNGTGVVTYSEVRRMARWLGIFTARDLAEALHVHEAVGQQYVKALLWHRLALDTGMEEEVGFGPEPIYEMDPLPRRVYARTRYLPPEIAAVFSMGGFLLYDRRGITQRLEHDVKRRQGMSMPGQGHRLRVREKQRKRMEAARKERSERDKAKARGEVDR